MMASCKIGDVVIDRWFRNWGYGYVKKIDNNGVYIEFPPSVVEKFPTWFKKENVRYYITTHLVFLKKVKFDD